MVDIAEVSLKSDGCDPYLGDNTRPEMVDEVATIPI